MIRIREIRLTLTLEDGQTVEGSLSPGGDMRWGNDLPHLAACVAPMEAMQAALFESGCYVGEVE